MKCFVPLRGPVYGPVRQIPRVGPSNTMGNGGRSAKYHGSQISFQIRKDRGTKVPPYRSPPLWKEEENGTSLEALSVLFLYLLNGRSFYYKDCYYGKEDLTPSRADLSTAYVS